MDVSKKRAINGHKRCLSFHEKRSMTRHPKRNLSAHRATYHKLCLDELKVRRGILDVWTKEKLYRKADFLTYYD